MMVIKLQYFCILCPAQYIDQVIDSEALSGAIDSAECLTGRIGAIPGVDRFKASVAVTARLGLGFAKIVQ